MKNSSNSFTSVFRCWISVIAILLYVQAGSKFQGFHKFTCPSSGFHKMDGECSRYYRCMFSGMSAAGTSQCPAQHVFDPEKHRCVPLAPENEKLCTSTTNKNHSRSTFTDNSFSGSMWRSHSTAMDADSMTAAYARKSKSDFMSPESAAPGRQSQAIAAYGGPNQTLAAASNSTTGTKAMSAWPPTQAANAMTNQDQAHATAGSAGGSPSSAAANNSNTQGFSENGDRSQSSATVGESGAVVSAPEHTEGGRAKMSGNKPSAHGSAATLLSHVSASSGIDGSQASAATASGSTAVAASDRNGSSQASAGSETGAKSSAGADELGNHSTGANADEAVPGSNTTASQTENRTATGRKVFSATDNTGRSSAAGETVRSFVSVESDKEGSQATAESEQGAKSIAYTAKSEGKAMGGMNTEPKTVPVSEGSGSASAGAVSARSQPIADTHFKT